MITRLRQFLTITLLVLFSLESVGNAFDADISSEEFSSTRHFSQQKKNLALLTWIIEQNENEERSDDDKVHQGSDTLLDKPSDTSFSQSLFLVGFRPVISSCVRGRGFILRLVCRLSI
jgi:hypothetical protein